MNTSKSLRNNQSNTTEGKSTHSSLLYYIIIIIPFVLFLLFLLFKYSYSQRTTSQLAQLNYSKLLQLSKLPQCSDIDPKYQYKLCDYYISASYMTPCVGNLHYDYVSTDMIKTVLVSGARYIQIPICSYNVDADARPIVATAIYGKQNITSLNTLELLEVFTTIRNFAFVSSNEEDNTINYPLIIHLILNTNNKFTLNQVANYIKQSMSDVLVPTSNYKTYPIWLEQVCNLLNKIIIIATPEYLGTNLEQIVIPTTSLFQTLDKELKSINSDTLITTTAPPSQTTLPSSQMHSYLRRLSEKEQTADASNFHSKYPSVASITNSNLDTIGTTILNDNTLLNPLQCYNKVGVSSVIPMDPADVTVVNNDPSNAFTTGCQIVAMNFQLNDSNMQNYIKIFSTSSYRLKPTSLRFEETETDNTTTSQQLALYTPIPTTNLPVLNQLVEKYANKLIALQPYALPTTYLTQIEANLVFKGIPPANTLPQSNLPYTVINTSTTDNKPSKNQCFRVVVSNLSSGNNNVSICLESILMPNYVITINGTATTLQTLSTKTAILKTQSFYLTPPIKRDPSNVQDKVSLLNVNTANNTQLYLAYQNKSLAALPDYNTDDGNIASTFGIVPVPFNFTVTITSVIATGGLFSSGGVVGVRLNDLSAAENFILIPQSQQNKGQIGKVPNVPFILKNAKTGTILSSDDNTNLLMDNNSAQTSNSLMKAVATQGFYRIVNSKGGSLTQGDGGVLKFTYPDTSATTSFTSNYLFNIELNYLI